MSRKPYFLPVSSICLNFFEKKKYDSGLVSQVGFPGKDSETENYMEKVYWDIFSGDEPVKEIKGKIGERKKLTLSVVRTAASADPAGSAGVGMAP